MPTSPLLLDHLPGRRHPRLRTMAGHIQRVVRTTPPVDVAVALAGGAHLQIADAPDTDLTGYGLGELQGHPLRPGPAPVALDLQAAVGALDTTERGPSTFEEWTDLPVLVRHLPMDTPTVGVTVPTALEVRSAQAIAQTITRLADALGVLLLVAGDLGAGHGDKPPRPDAAAASAAFDQQVVTALDNGRATDLLHLDGDLANAAQARATGALRILGAVLAQAKIGTVVRATAAPLGVGYVVAGG